MKTDLLGLDSCTVWSTDLAFEHFHSLDNADTKRTTERRLQDLRFLPVTLAVTDLRDELGRRPIQLVLRSDLDQARSKRQLVLFAQLQTLPNGRECLHANDARGGRYWVPLAEGLQPQKIAAALTQLQGYLGKTLAVFAHGTLVRLCRNIPPDDNPLVRLMLLAYPEPLELPPKLKATQRKTSATHLKRLEAESIYIMREALAEADNPVMLYSAGKDSSVMLHLARKAFYPASPPFALLHVDTRWKFQQMTQFRDLMAQTSGVDLRVHINPEAIAKNINPFDHGSALHTGITKTEGLKQALDKYKFDVIFGGARRDEEKSRAKERIFSFRTVTHQWDPKNQRPELWHLYNTRKSLGESIRVFPLSNWTELDIWQYIYQEAIAVVPLYFAKERPVVVRDGMIMLVDDDRCRLLPGEQIQTRKVRFRTLGCYPLTGAVESEAANIEDLILELVNTRSSERQGRKIDTDGAASMEKKKQEGYF